MSREGRVTQTEKTLGVGQPVCISCLADIPGIDPRVCAACASKGIR